MKKFTVILFSLMIIVGLNLVAAARADEYSDTVNVFRESPAVAKFFKNAYGYAVFPIVEKAGFIVGGSYGKGQVYRGGELKGTASVLEGSIGWQAGGQVFSEIIFFQDERAYYEFTSGNLEFGATAQAVAVTASVQAKTGTSGNSAGASAGPETMVQAETSYTNGMVTFVQAQGGLMVDLSIGGQKFIFEPL